MFFCLNIFGQKSLHEDYGTWVMEQAGNTISLKAYVTVEEETNCKTLTKLDTICYKYKLYLVSKSKYKGDVTSTWVYGGRVVANKVELTSKQFPEGFIILVGVKPTLIYTYETNNKDNNINLGITWDKAVYEPRIRK